MNIRRIESCPMVTTRLPFWHISNREMAAHARVLGIIGWLTVIALAVVRLLSPGRLGPDFQPDFVHFYTIGHLAYTGDTEQLYDGASLYARQIALVPESDNGLSYRPVYSPLVAAGFALLSRLPWFSAWAVWGLFSLSAYLLTVRAVHGRVSDVLPYVMAFPPIWELIATGQTGIVPFLGFAWAWFGLDRHRPFVAGIALSLLALKPQHGLMLAAILPLCRQWRVIGGAFAGLALQIAGAVAVAGQAVTRTYVRTVADVAMTAAQAEPKLFLQHSLRSVTSILPGRVGVVAYLMLSLLAIGAVWRVWLASHDWRVRMSAAVLGSCLINPHFFVYDAIVLVLPAIWLVDGDRTKTDWGWLWPRAYWLTVALLLPTAYVIPVQASVLLLGELMWQFGRRSTARPLSSQPEFVVQGAR